MNEFGWPLLGRCQDSVTVGFRMESGVKEGTPHTVDLDSAWIFRRELERRDVVGFYHTHPNCEAIPSITDVDTMQAYADSFGKSMLCVIEGTDGIRGFIFEPNSVEHWEVEELEIFPPMGDSKDPLVVAVLNLQDYEPWKDDDEFETFWEKDET